MHRNSYYNGMAEQSWAECCTHEEEVALLQQKLMEMHGKLLAQLDVCQQQQITIQQQELTICQLAPHSPDPTSFRNPSFPSPPTDRYDSLQSQLGKNELLQADLEAMRTRILTEITEKNRLREEMEEMQRKYRRELAQQVKKFEGLEIVYSKLKESKGEGKQARREEDVHDLQERLAEMEKKYQRERERNMEMQAEKRELVQRIRQIEGQKDKETIRDKPKTLQQKQNRNERENRTNEPQNDQLREITNLKLQIGKLNKNIELRDGEFKQRDDRRRREGEVTQPRW